MDDEAPGTGDITDRERAGILSAANIIAIGAFALVDAACFHSPSNWTGARACVYIGCSLLAVYFALCAGLGLWLLHTVQRLRRKKPTGVPVAQFPTWLYLGTLTNFLVVCGILILSGGAQSPLIAFPGGFVLFSQFLANTTAAVIISLVGGIALVAAVAWWPPLAQIAAQHAPELRNVTPSGSRSALALVAIAAIIVGAICTIPRK